METPTRADPPEQHSATPRGPAHAHAPRRRRVLRVLGWFAVVVLVLTLLVGTITAIAGLNAKRSLDRGRAELQDGKRALVAGDLARATDAFSTAEASFSDAEARVSGGLAGVASSVPLAGRTLRVVDGVAVAGRELAAAGGQLSAAVGRLPDGLGSLSPVNGRIPVEEIASLSDDVRAAAAHAEAAQAALDATPSSLLVGPVADARNEAVVQVSAAATTLRSASSLLDAFPAFAGADGPRRYLLVAESPAEQRGTGGIWGAYAVLTADDGRLTVSPFKGVLTLKQLPPDAVPAPNPDYRRNYDAYGGAGSFRDLNMTPDFPSAAKAALGNYEASTGERLDGVISVDPFALQHLLAVTGPADVPHLGITVGSGTVVDLLANEAYIRFANQGKARKAVLGAVAGLAFERFLEQPGQALAKLKAVGRSVSDGDLKVYSTDPRFEQGLATVGARRRPRRAPGRRSALGRGQQPLGEQDRLLRDSLAHLRRRTRGRRPGVRHHRGDATQRRAKLRYPRRCDPSDREGLRERRRRLPRDVFVSRVVRLGERAARRRGREAPRGRGTRAPLVSGRDGRALTNLQLAADRDLARRRLAG